MTLSIEKLAAAIPCSEQGDMIDLNRRHIAKAIEGALPTLVILGRSHDRVMIIVEGVLFQRDFPDAAIAREFVAQCQEKFGIKILGQLVI